MTITFLRDTSKIYYAVCQAAIIGVAIAVNRTDDMYGITASAWLIGVAVFFYIIGLFTSLTAKGVENVRQKKEQLANPHHGKRHRLKIPKNTTLTLEVEP